MFLNKLLLKDFGKFNNKEIDLKPGLNLIYGENEAGKTTLKEFIVGMLYGIDKSRGLGARLDNYELRKPLDGRGFSGKAYINHKDKSFFIERSFLRYNRKTSVMDVKSGREIKLRNKNSLYGTMLDLDKSTYANTLCIGEHGAAPGKELAAELINYLANLSTTGSADIDKSAAVERLKKEKSRNNPASVQKKLDDIATEMEDYSKTDEQLRDVRTEIAKLDEEFTIETARRKREARKLVETQDGEVIYEDNEEINAKLDSLVQSSVNLKSELTDEEEKEKKITEKPWFIALTGIFVVGIIAAMVYILPFSEGVRQLFVVCTALFVVVTIVEDLFAKGVFQDDITTPSEEEFKRIIRELEDSITPMIQSEEDESEQETQIDMSFATEYAEKKSELKLIEKQLLDKKKKYEELQDEYNVFSSKKRDMEKEIRAIDLAIDTINDMSARIHGDLGFLINDNISDIVSKITDGKYQDVYLDENLHVMVRDGDGYVGIEYLSAGTVEQIYLAVRLSVARLLCKDKMPLIIDDIFTNYDEKRLINTLDCLKTIDTEQIILLTANPHIGDMLDDLDMDYNYVEL